MSLHVNFVIQEDFLCIQNFLVKLQGLLLQQLNVVPDTNDRVAVAALLTQRSKIG